jgi:hypothetical protein
MADKTDSQPEVIDQVDYVINILQKAREWAVARRVAEVNQNESRSVVRKAMRDLLDAENELLGALEALYPDDTKGIEKKTIVTVN